MGQSSKNPQAREKKKLKLSQKNKQPKPAKQESGVVMGMGEAGDSMTAVSMDMVLGNSKEHVKERTSLVETLEKKMGKNKSVNSGAKQFLKSISYNGSKHVDAEVEERNEIEEVISVVAPPQDAPEAPAKKEKKIPANDAKPSRNIMTSDWWVKGVKEGAMAVQVNVHFANGCFKAHSEMLDERMEVVRFLVENMVEMCDPESDGILEKDIAEFKRMNKTDDNLAVLAYKARRWSKCMSRHPEVVKKFFDSFGVAQEERDEIAEDLDVESGFTDASAVMVLGMAARLSRYGPVQLTDWTDNLAQMGTYIERCYNFDHKERMKELTAHDRKLITAHMKEEHNKVIGFCQTVNNALTRHVGPT